MNNKEEKLISAQVEKIRNFAEKYNMVYDIFPDLNGELDKVEKELLYDDVEDKDGKIIFNRKKKSKIAHLCSNIQGFYNQTVNLFAGSHPLENRMLSADILQSKQEDILGYINNQKSGVVSNIYKTYLEGLENTLQSFQKASLKELMDAFAEVTKEHFFLVDADKIAACSSLKAIKKLNVPAIDELVDNYGKLYMSVDELQAPDMQGLIDRIIAKYQNCYRITQEDFEKSLQKWLHNAAGQLRSVQHSEVAQAPVLFSRLENLLKQQFSSLANPVFALVGEALWAEINGLEEEGMQLQLLAAALQGSMPQVKAPILSEDQLGTFPSETFVEEQLTQHVDLPALLQKAVDTNSPIYLVVQPTFKSELLAKLNDWRNKAADSLGQVAGTVMQFDGCTLQAAVFSQKVCESITLSRAEEYIGSGLSKLEDLPLNTKKDSDRFNEWEAVWHETVNGLDFNAIYEEMADTPNLLYELYINPGEYLPNVEKLQHCLLSAVGDIEKAGHDERMEIQANINRLADRLLYIETCKVNRDRARSAPNDLNQLVQEIYELFAEIRQNYETAKASFEAFKAKCNEVVDIQNDASMLFATTMYGAVVDLAMKAIKADDVPVIGDFLGKVVDYGIEQFAETTLNWSGALMPQYEADLSAIDAFADTSGSLNSFKMSLIKLERLVNGYAGYMNSEITNNSNYGYDDPLVKIDQEQYAVIRDSYSNFQEYIRTITEAMKQLREDLVQKAYTASRYEEVIIATWIDADSQVFRNNESWYHGWDFTILCSDTFIVKMEQYGLLSSSEIRSCISSVESVVENFLSYCSNAAKAITGHDASFKIMAEALKNIMEWAELNNIEELSK